MMIKNIKISAEYTISEPKNDRRLVILAEELAEHIKHAKEGDTFAISACGNYCYVPKDWCTASDNALDQLKLSR